MAVRTKRRKKKGKESGMLIKDQMCQAVIDILRSAPDKTMAKSEIAEAMKKEKGFKQTRPTLLTEISRIAQNPANKIRRKKRGIYKLMSRTNSEPAPVHQEQEPEKEVNPDLLMAENESLNNRLQAHKKIIMDMLILT